MITASLLLADDDEGTRSALTLLLTSYTDFIQISSVTNWADLLESAARYSPDAILLDWELPGGSAVSRLQILRKNNPRCKVIAMSARHEARSQAEQTGVDAFIHKTDPPEQVLQTLKAILSSVGIPAMDETQA